MGSPIIDVTVLLGGGQWFYDHSTKTLVIKCVTVGGGPKIVQNYVTSFMDDP